MEYYCTPKDSASPLEVSVKLEERHGRKDADHEASCTIYISGKWDLTTAQREIRKAFKMAEKYPLFLLRIDLSQLVLKGNLGRGIALAATLVEFYKLT